MISNLLLCSPFCILLLKEGFCDHLTKSYGTHKAWIFQLGRQKTISLPKGCVLKHERKQYQLHDLLDPVQNANLGLLVQSP